jgi:hypothetical protein
LQSLQQLCQRLFVLQSTKIRVFENSRSPQNNPHNHIKVKADLVIRSGFFIWRQFVLPILPPIRTPSFVFSLLLPRTPPLLNPIRLMIAESSFKRNSFFRLPSWPFGVKVPISIKPNQSWTIPYTNWHPCQNQRQDQQGFKFQSNTSVLIVCLQQEK